MDLYINGREITSKKICMAMDKIGVGGIDITVSSEARLKIVNSYTNELKRALIRAFELFPMPLATNYLKAFDLVMAALNYMRREYEDEFIPAIYHGDDSSQMSLGLWNVSSVC